MPQRAGPQTPHYTAGRPGEADTDRVVGPVVDALRRRHEITTARSAKNYFNYPERTVVLRPRIWQAARFAAPRLPFGGEFGVQFTEHAVARKDLADAGVRLAALADRRDELAVLKLDAVCRYVDLGHVDRLLAPGHQVVVAGDVGAVVADVAEEAAERPVVVEAQRQRADLRARRAELDRHVHRDAELGVDRPLHGVRDPHLLTG